MTVQKTELNVKRYAQKMDFYWYFPPLCFLFETCFLTRSRVQWFLPSRNYFFSQHFGHFYFINCFFLRQKLLLKRSSLLRQTITCQTLYFQLNDIRWSLASYRYESDSGQSSFPPSDGETKPCTESGRGSFDSRCRKN